MTPSCRVEIHDPTRSSGFAYIASPYSHPDQGIRNGRHIGAVAFLRWCLQRRDWAYSPIAHCHTAALGGLPTDHDFWLEMNHTMMRAASALYVLRLPRWDISLGVADEIAYATSLGLPTRHFEAAGPEEDYREIDLAAGLSNIVLGGGP